ncbi:hypothetical protein A2Z33_01655 [Candidatus Gottesmanbacteria bacterium RBG_16_52_11]|uniref:Hydrogenase maturation protease n=1 Tax=Candidatus Gottesmanbacteria bacterium RBG_16_52_11 TaxID=1798374 RepID=A0A1F5YPB9_9BACT|nr:MAG: hypothetical protein A2Z33_01655 [Candidatus Gottesmanbacteria bacterium RBG_16_52_11]
MVYDELVKSMKKTVINREKPVKRVVWVLGNPDYPADGLPVSLIPQLSSRMPDVTFLRLDPLEDFTAAGRPVFLDTVAGLRKVSVFDSPENFREDPRLSAHDYGLKSGLVLALKIGRITGVRIVGIPPKQYPGIFEDIVRAIRKCL